MSRNNKVDNLLLLLSLIITSGLEWMSATSHSGIQCPQWCPHLQTCAELRSPVVSAPESWSTYQNDLQKKRQKEKEKSSKLREWRKK